MQLACGAHPSCLMAHLVRDKVSRNTLNIDASISPKRALQHLICYVRTLSQSRAASHLIERQCKKQRCNMWLLQLCGRHYQRSVGRYFCRPRNRCRFFRAREAMRGSRVITIAKPDLSEVPFLPRSALPYAFLFGFLAPSFWCFCSFLARGLPSSPLSEGFCVYPLVLVHVRLCPCVSVHARV